jgi:hypothetical protein
MGCLPCEKELIDQGMGRLAARFYAAVLGGKPVAVAAAEFYENVTEEITQPVAQNLLRGVNGKLSKEQHAAVMAQIDKQCYRADKLIAWALIGNAQNDLAAWTNEILGWVKDDQTFYTDLIAELGG